MILRLLIVVALTVAGGCSRMHPDDDGRRINCCIAVHGDMVVARDRWGEPAWIGPGGTLSIGERPVPLEPAQRELAMAYRAQAISLYRVSLALIESQDANRERDRQGAASADRAADTTVVSDSPADAAEPELATICTKIAGLADTQDALAQAVPDFRPHASLPADVGEVCATSVAL